MPNDAASSVVLKFAEDATLEVLISGIDYGQGLMTVAAQFAAEALDLPIETIRVRGQPGHRPLALRLADGGLAPDLGHRQRRPARGRGASRRQLFDMAAEALGVPGRGADARRTAASSTSRRGRSMPLAAAGHGLPVPRRPHHRRAGGGGRVATSPRGSSSSTPRRARARSRSPSGPSAPRRVEVSVDPETGQVTVEKVAACYDVGKVVNPGLIRGQTYGGIVQGLGTGMMEELVLDEKTGRAAQRLAHGLQDPVHRGRARRDVDATSSRRRRRTARWAPAASASTR